jgi:hypothetical protein
VVEEQVVAEEQEFLVEEQEDLDQQVEQFFLVFNLQEELEEMEPLV